MLQTLLITSYSSLFLLLPLVFSSRTDELFEFNKIIVLYLAAILIGSLWVLRMIREKRWIFQKTILTVPWILFLASQTISTIFSMHPWTSWLGYYSRFNGGLASLLCYALLYFAFVSNVRKKDIWNLLHSMLIGGTIAALYALPEHFGNSISCWIITKKIPFGVDCWVQDVQSRIFGTFGQPNWLAAYMVGLMPLSFGLFVHSWHISRKKNLLYLGIAALFFMVLIFTRSRSGVLGLTAGSSLTIAGLLIATILQKKQAFISFMRGLAKKFVLPLSIGIAALGVLFSIYGGSLRDSLLGTIGISFHTSINRIVSSPAEATLPSSGTQLEVGGTESGIIRSIVWQGAVQVWKRYPIFGSGVETFAYSYYKDRPVAHNKVSEWDFLYNKAHNEWLNYLATTGAVGLATYLILSFSIFFWSIRKILNALKDKHPTFETTLVPTALLAGLIAVHVSNILGFSTVAVSLLSFSMFPAFIVLYADTSKISTSEQSQHSQTTGLSAFSVIGNTATILFSCWLIASVFNYWNADIAYAEAKQLIAIQSPDALKYAIQLYKKAEALSPQEALFPSEYAAFASDLAAGAIEAKENQIALTMAQEALAALERAKKLNNVHLNFYKSRARTFIQLSAIEPNFLRDARQTMLEAHDLSPTDPKITYNLGVVSQDLKDLNEAKKWLMLTLSLKPDYPGAQEQLNKLSDQK